MGKLATKKSRLAAGLLNSLQPIRNQWRSGPLAIATPGVRVLALSAGILALLSRLLTAALLLAWFLAGLLILLARILVLVGHRVLPC
jgi:hypothetical protein